MCAELLAQIPTEANNLSDVCKGFEWEWWHWQFFSYLTVICQFFDMQGKEGIFKRKSKVLSKLNFKSTLRILWINPKIYIFELYQPYPQNLWKLLQLGPIRW